MHRRKRTEDGSTLRQRLNLDYRNYSVACNSFIYFFFVFFNAIQSKREDEHLLDLTGICIIEMKIREWSRERDRERRRSLCIRVLMD